MLGGSAAQFSKLLTMAVGPAAQTTLNLVLKTSGRVGGHLRVLLMPMMRRQSSLNIWDIIMEDTIIISKMVGNL